MSRRLFVTLAALASAFCPVANGAHATFRLAGTVVGVRSSETLSVRLAGSKREQVRLIGVDAPARGECFGAAAEHALRVFANGRRVTLTGDPSQPQRDRRRRLQAYATVRKRVDLGGTLIGGGFARVSVGAGAFRKRSVYRALQATARSQHLGLWATCR
jgi:micrococcal nuclease